MLGKLYKKWNISDSTNLSQLESHDYPILSDLYTLIEEEYKGYEKGNYQLYTEELLQGILLGLHSMCQGGAESKFFNGHTNITSNRFIVFGVKGGILQASKNVRMHYYLMYYPLCQINCLQKEILQQGLMSYIYSLPILQQ